MSSALDQLLAMHTRKILHYKRLLEHAQVSAAAQLHALQAEVQLLRDQATGPAQHPRPTSNPEAFCSCAARKCKGFWSDDDDQGNNGPTDVAKALCSDSQGHFSEKEIKQALRGLSQSDRMKLITTTLECL